MARGWTPAAPPPGLTACVLPFALPHHQSLNISGWSDVSLDTVQVIKSMPALTTVRLVRCPRLGELALGELATLPRLALLSVAECQGVSDQGLARLAASPALTSLDLRCAKPPPPSCVLVPFRTYALARYGCSRYCQEGLVYTALCIQAWRLTPPRPLLFRPSARSRCIRMTDMGAAALASMQSLMILNLGGCVKITDTGVACLSRLRCAPARQRLIPGAT